MDDSPVGNFRLQLHANGYQFGKYSMLPPANTLHEDLNTSNDSVNSIGPQIRFPVPEGVLNHKGRNFISLTL